MGGSINWKKSKLTNSRPTLRKFCSGWTLVWKACREIARNLVGLADANCFSLTPVEANFVTVVGRADQSLELGLIALDC